MSNVLVSVRFTVDVSEEEAERLVGRPDDDSEEWYGEACEAAQRAVEDEPIRYLENAAPPEVEA